MEDLLPTFVEETRPNLPYDVLSMIYTHCDILTKRKLQQRTNKAIFGHLRFTPTELAELDSMETWRPNEKLLFQAIVTNNNELFVQQISGMLRRTRVRRKGLQLAVRHSNRHASWVLLALATLDKASCYKEQQDLVDSARHQLDPNDLAGIAKMSEFNEMEKNVLFQHLLTNDNAHYYKSINYIRRPALAVGLQLAGKYGFNHGAMVLLACNKLATTVDPKLKEIISVEESRRTPTELADLAMIRNSQGKEKEFFQSILRKDKNAEYKQLHQLSEAAHIFGLQLAVRYGSSWDAWLLIAWDLAHEECHELVAEAKGHMSQTELSDIFKIHSSTPTDRDLFRAVITNNTIAVEGRHPHFIEEDDALKFGLQLAIRRGCIGVGRLLYFNEDCDSEEELFEVGEKAAEESGANMDHWEAICYESECEVHDNDPFGHYYDDYYQTVYTGCYPYEYQE